MLECGCPPNARSGCSARRFRQRRVSACRSVPNDKIRISSGITSLEGLGFARAPGFQIASVTHLRSKRKMRPQAARAESVRIDSWKFADVCSRVKSHMKEKLTDHGRDYGDRVERAT